MTSTSTQKSQTKIPSIPILLLLFLLLSLLSSTQGKRIFVGGTFNDTHADNTMIHKVGIYDVQYFVWDSMLGGIPDSGSSLGADSVVFDSVFDGNGVVYFGGVFDSFGGVNGVNVALYRIDDQTASFLASSMDGAVKAVEVNGGVLYVGGNFTTVDGVVTGPVAKWDSTNGWEAIDATMTGSVEALFVSSNVLYVGGDFTQNGVGNKIASYDIAGSSWTHILGICTGSVLSIFVDGEIIYVGGDFSTYGPVCNETKGILTYSAVDGWSIPIQNSLFVGKSVHAIAKSMNGIIIGGDFSKYGSVSLDSFGIIKDGAIEPLTSTQPFTNDLIVYDIEVDTDGSVYICGHFKTQTSIYDGIFYLNPNGVWEAVNEQLGLDCDCLDPTARTVVYTVSVLPDGTQPTNWDTDTESTSSDTDIIGIVGGLLEELGLIFQGSEIYNTSSADYANLTVTTWFELTGQLGWIFWAIMFGSLAVLSFILAIMVNCCFKICGCLQSIGNDSLSSSSDF